MTMGLLCRQKPAYLLLIHWERTSAIRSLSVLFLQRLQRLHLLMHRDSCWSLSTKAHRSLMTYVFSESAAFRSLFQACFKQREALHQFPHLEMVLLSPSPRFYLILGIQCFQRLMAPENKQFGARIDEGSYDKGTFFFPESSAFKSLRTPSLDFSLSLSLSQKRATMKIVMHIPGDIYTTFLQGRNQE